MTDKTKKHIDAILNSYDTVGAINHLEGENLPSRESIHAILALLKQILFPGYFESSTIQADSLPYIIGQKVTAASEQLVDEIFKSKRWQDKAGQQNFDAGLCRQASEDIVDAFFSYIPDLRRRLKRDETATFGGDPAAKNEPEIILSYPGFMATTVYRIANFFYRNAVPLIPRMMAEIVHSETGVDIHPGATIGDYFCIDHGTGIVVGETAVIGNHVKLYQGVTIGALSVSKTLASKKRHPTIEDHVTIYARTTILGGETTIGANSIIGGNVWLTKSVPPNSKVYQNSEATQTTAGS